MSVETSNSIKLLQAQVKIASEHIRNMREQIRIQDNVINKLRCDNEVLTKRLEIENDRNARSI
jgi:hypothetical protein